MAKLTPQQQTTINYYDKNALEWAQGKGLGTTTPYFQSEFDAFIKQLPKGRILEISTGHGTDAGNLISHYGTDNYLGIEPAKGLLELTQKHNPTGHFQLSTLEELDLPKPSFNGFWASAVLIHIPKPSIKSMLTKLHDLLTPGGVGFISLLGGEGDMLPSRPGRFYSLYSQTEFTKLLDQANLKIIENNQFDRDGATWLTFIIQKQ